MRKLLVCAVLLTAVLSFADEQSVGFETPVPPSGADDLTVQVVPAWAELTKDAASVRRAVYPVARCPRARWRGPNALELPVRFSENPIVRAYWDVWLHVDLSRHQGLEFDFYCGDIDRFSQIRLYLKSGKGWYATWPFAPKQDGTWCRMRFAKADFMDEGGAEGFDKIDGLRIAAWRARDLDTTLGIANLAYTDAVARKLTKEELAAREAETRAWMKTQPGRKDEWRAFWCHTPCGMGGDETYDWDRGIRALRENGFTAICVNLAWSGRADYVSDVVPSSGAVRKYGDQVEKLKVACRKYGIELHAWKMCWLMGDTNRVDATYLKEVERRGAFQIDNAGVVHRELICPSDPFYFDQEVAVFVELAKKGVDGIHFDHIRLENGTCFCPRCRAAFEKSLGRTVPTWPTISDSEIQARWLDFRAAHVSELVKTVAERVRREAPGVQLSAAVFPNPKSDKYGLGQDWTLWCREGWLDWVAPMNYTVSPMLLKSMVASQRDAVGAVRQAAPGSRVLALAGRHRSRTRAGGADPGHPRGRA